MTTLHRLLLATLPLAALAGCSQGTAAPILPPASKPVTSASLAPSGDNATPATVRIPQAPRQASPVLGKPTAAKPVNKPTMDADDDDNVSAVEDRRQEKSGRKNNNRQDVKRKTDKETTTTTKYTAAPANEEDKAPSPAAPGKPEGAKKEEATPSVAAVSETTGTPVSTTTPVVATPNANVVTYGTANTHQVRNYKKPTVPSNAPSWFTENDKDNDGQLTMDEWPASRMGEFTKYDRNGDGIITLEEAMRTVPKVVAPPPATAAAPAAATPAVATTSAPVATATAAPAAVAASSSGGAALSDEDAKRRVERIFGFVDANKDGILDEKEIDNSASIKSVDWRKYDANKDGKLDKTEALALFKAEGNNMRGGMGGGPGMGGPGGGGPWANRSPEEMAKTMFDNMDRNKTGKLTKEQFPGMWRDRFEEVDTNKDGFVDLAEFKAGAAKMMQGRGGPGGGRGPGGPGGGGGGRGGFGGDNGGGRGPRGGFGGGQG